jgi:hypothetical protein
LPCETFILSELIDYLELALFYNKDFVAPLKDLSILNLSWIGGLILGDDPTSIGYFEGVF